MSSGSGGLMQLVAYGAQDIYLTGNPSVTYFKMIYRRYTNFSMEMISLYFQVKPSFLTTQRTRSTVKIARNADLIADCFLVFDLPEVLSNRENSFKWVPFIGQAIIHTVELFIDGQRIDRQYGTWLNIWNELVLDIGKRRAYYEMIGNTSSMRPEVYPSDDTTPAIPARRLYIPLEFGFCQNYGLAIPLIALQYQEVFLTFEFTPLNELFTIGTPPLSPQQLFADEVTGENLILKQNLIAQGWSASTVFWKYVKNWGQNTYVDGNYIYLDTDERRLYAQTTHEYLIPQIQFNQFLGLKPGPNTVQMEFQHPSKELLWVFRRMDYWKRNDWTNYTRLEYPADLERLNNLAQQVFDNPVLRPGGSADPVTILEQAPVMDLITSLNTNKDCHTNNENFNTGTNIMNDCVFLFNGHERFQPRDERYFTDLQVYKYHTSLPSIPGVHVYTFCLKPESDIPSGSANFSRLDKVQFRTNLRGTSDLVAPDNQYELLMFSRCYNILRIMSGMGNIVFAN